MKKSDVAKAAANKAWETRRKREDQRGDLFSPEKQAAIKAKLEKEKNRKEAIAAGPDAYQEFLRTVAKQGRPEVPERILILVPPKLLWQFQQFCNTESYSFVEGVREAMRGMLREYEFATPEDQVSEFANMMKGMKQVLQENQDPSTLPSRV